MTELDRLEAFARDWRASGSSEYIVHRGPTYTILTLTNVDDLVRVARAAKEVTDFWDKESPGYVPQVSRLSMALDPLYREVES